jgi:predicted nucleotidyltransferase
MTRTVAADPLLPRLRAELEKLYGPKLQQVLLYGSRARGDHGPDSDYDVLVVVEGPFDYWKEVEKLSRLSTDITWETVEEEHPAVVSFKPMTTEQFQARTGFLHNVRKEAIPL